MDIVGLWQIGRDKLYLVTCLDNFSGFVKVLTSTECPTAHQCALHLGDCVAEAQFTPSKICTDHGPQFTSSVFKQAVEGLGATLEHSGAYAHWAAGKIERWHRVLNERVKAAILTYRAKVRRRHLAQGKGNIMVQVRVSEVCEIVREVVARCNVSPRTGGRPSPHDLVRPYPAWIYTEINAYRPLPINPLRLRDIAHPPVLKGGPQVGELWRVPVRPGEHAVEIVLDLAPKLKPNHIYGRVMDILGFGRYSVLLAGSSRAIPKERRDLFSRVEAVPDIPDAPMQVAIADSLSAAPPDEQCPEQQAVAQPTRSARRRKLTSDRLEAEGFAVVAMPKLASPGDEDPTSSVDQSSC